MKQFVTEESFWELFPEAQIGIVVAHNMKPTAEVAPADAAAIARALAEANGKADQHLESNTISQNEVVAVWREAYQKFKTKKGARCSIENLLKRVLKGNPVGSITPSVDIYNTVSLTHALPVGGEDIDAMAGDIRLGIFQGGCGVIQIQLAGGVLLVQRFQAFHITPGLGRLGLAFLQLGFRFLYSSTIFIGINHKQGLILLHPFTFLKQHFL